VTDPTMPPPPPPGGMPPPPPPMGDPNGAYGQPQDTSGNIFGILALIGGIVSIALCCVYAGIWGGVPAIILGVVGKKRADEGKATNKTLANVGFILGIIGVAIFVLQLILLATGVSANLVSQMQKGS
jgi:hypothetical protein